VIVNFKIFGIGLHSVCTISQCCLSLYSNVGGLREGPGKTFRWSWEVLKKFWNFLSVKMWEPCWLLQSRSSASSSLAPCSLSLQVDSPAAPFPCGFFFFVCGSFFTWSRRVPLLNCWQTDGYGGWLDERLSGVKCVHSSAEVMTFFSVDVCECTHTLPSVLMTPTDISAFRSVDVVSIVSFLFRLFRFLLRFGPLRCFALFLTGWNTTFTVLCSAEFPACGSWNLWDVLDVKMWVTLCRAYLIMFDLKHRSLL